MGGGRNTLFILLPPTGKAGRNTAATLATDGDGDGVNNFDEITRFPEQFLALIAQVRQVDAFIQ